MFAPCRFVMTFLFGLTTFVRVCLKFFHFSSVATQSGQYIIFS